jgi:hypothetical protein
VRLTDPDVWDRRALVDGISVAALGAVPFGVIGRLIVGDDGSTGVLALFTVLVLVGLVLGAGVAAWRQLVGRPLSHGIATALVTFGAIQAVGVARRLVGADPVRWSRIASSGLLSLVAGTVGGLLGSVMISRGVRSKRP